MDSIERSTLRVCETDACMQTATAIKDKIDFNIDPCSDFYQYTCGAWIEKSTLPPDRAEISVLADLGRSHREHLRDLLEGTYDDLLKKALVNLTDSLLEHQDVDRHNFQKVKDYYTSCMDESTLTRVSTTPLLPSLRRLLDQSDVTDLILEEYFFGATPLLKIYVDVDDKNPTENVIFIDQLALVAPSKQSYEDKALMNQFQQRVKSLVDAIIGSTGLISLADVEQKVESYVNTEILLASMSMNEVDQYNATLTYNQMLLSDVQSKYSLVDWQKVIRRFAPKEASLPDTVIVRTVDYLDKLMQWYSSTPNAKDLLKNYFVIRHIIHSAYYLDSKTATLKYAIDNDLFSGVKTIPPRWKYCLDDTSSSLGDILGRYYVITAFGGEEKREKVLKFLDSMQLAWEERLKKTTWLDEQTLKMALDKLHKLRKKAAYGISSPDLRSAPSIEQYYQSMENIQPTTYFENVVRATLWHINYTWSRLDESVDRELFDMDAMDANAYYSATDNEIVVAAGILTDPVYNDEVPDYLNYGAIGMVVGHEITHAFDGTGRLYDGDGKLQNWWTNNTFEAFNEKEKCFIEQYSKFSEKDANGKDYHWNGELTASENLADNTGLSTSYDAYTLLAKTKEQVLLPNLDLTPEQLLFVNYGQIWCRKATPQSVINQMLTDPHSSGRARINGVVQNSEVFAKAFNCPAGSPMNPITKCSIW